MSVQKTATKIINETDYATLGHGATTSLANCTAIDLSKATQCVLQLYADTVPADVTLTFQLYASYDGTTYDGTPWSPNSDWSSGWTTTAAEEVETSPEIPPLPKYLKVRVTNNHGSSDVTNLRVYAIVQTVG